MGPLRRSRQAAAASPTASVSSVAVALVSSDIQTGDQSIGVIAAIGAEL
jgi:hypothetical protein